MFLYSRLPHKSIEIVKVVTHATGRPKVRPQETCLHRRLWEVTLKEKRNIYSTLLFTEGVAQQYVHKTYS